MLERQQSGTTFYVYRAYDADGVLLYAGRTQHLVRRFKLHLLKAHWIGQVETITVERFSTKAGAIRGELHAIFSDRPRWNIQHAWDPKRVARDRDAAILAATPDTFEEWLAISRRINAITEALEHETIHQGETQS